MSSGQSGVLAAVGSSALNANADHSLPSHPSIDTSKAVSPQGSSSAASGTTQSATTPTASQKADKPRPHVCGTCSRSFARLEHLKRHERSHTKEKPFECPQCSRCFARRDLLLRHQQKLHQAGNTSSRARNGRRESTGGVPPATLSRVRKNSVAGGSLSVGPSGSQSAGIRPVTSSAGGSSSAMRPRANTISTISNVDRAMLSYSLNNLQNVPPFPDTIHTSSNLDAIGLQTSVHMPHHGHSQSVHHHHNYHGYHTSVDSFDFHQLQSPYTNQIANSLHPAAPINRLDTQNMYSSPNIENVLRSAPILTTPADSDMDKLFNSSTTINPAHLHFVPSSQDNFPTLLSEIDDINSGSFDWSLSEITLSGQSGGNAHLAALMGHNNEMALDESSPSVLSTASQSGGFGEVMLDGSNAVNPNPNVWSTQGHSNLPTTLAGQTSYTMDSNLFPELSTASMHVGGHVSAVSVPEMAPPSISTIHDLFGSSAFSLSSPALFPLNEDNL